MLEQRRLLAADIRSVSELSASEIVGPESANPAPSDKATEIQIDEDGAANQVGSSSLLDSLNYRYEGTKVVPGSLRLSGAIEPEGEGDADCSSGGQTPTLAIGDGYAREGSVVQIPVTASNVCSNFDATFWFSHITTEDNDISLGSPNPIDEAQIRTFSSSAPIQYLSIPSVSDAVIENEETFKASFYNATTTVNLAASGGSDYGVGTIDDTPPPPVTLTLDNENATVTEGETGYFVIELSNALTQSLTVDYKFYHETTEPGDFTPGATTGSTVFTPGTTLKPISFFAVDDAHVDDESVEELSVSITGVSLSNVNYSTTKQSGYIEDNDIEYTIYASPDTKTEGNELLSTNVFQQNSAPVEILQFDVTVIPAPLAGDTVTVSYALIDDTAVYGSDYVHATKNSMGWLTIDSALSGTLTFTSSTPTQSVYAPVVSDLIWEDPIPGDVKEPEEMNLQLFGQTITRSPGAVGTAVTKVHEEYTLGKIVDDDDKYEISISEPEKIEGNSGYTDPNMLVFELSVEPAPQAGLMVEVNYELDELVGSLPVADHLGDWKQAFFESNGAYMLSNSRIGTLQLTDADIPHPAVDKAVAKIYVAINGDLDIEEQVIDGTTYNSEFLRARATAAEVQKLSNGLTANVPVIFVESLGEIIDDDIPYTVSIGDASRQEGDDEYSQPLDILEFELSASPAVVEGQQIVVTYELRELNDDELLAETGQAADANGVHPRRANEDVDWRSASESNGLFSLGPIASSGTVTLTAGSSTESIYAAIFGDLEIEESELFAAEILNAVVEIPSGDVSASTVDWSHDYSTGEIIDDDVLIQLSVANPVQIEGGILKFGVSLSEPAPRDLVVTYATADGIGPTAATAADYVPKSGSILFPAGQINQFFLMVDGSVLPNAQLVSAIDVQTIDDNLYENIDEHMFLDVDSDFELIEVPAAVLGRSWTMK